MAGIFGIPQKHGRRRLQGAHEIGGVALFLRDNDLEIACPPVADFLQGNADLRVVGKRNGADTRALSADIVQVMNKKRGKPHAATRGISRIDIAPFITLGHAPAIVDE